MTLLRKALATVGERREWQGPWGPYGSDGLIPPPGYGGFGTSAGEIVTERTAMALVDFYACVTLIADAIAMLPRTEVVVRNGVHEKIGAVDQFVAQPHASMSDVAWYGQMLWSYLVRGNAYAVVDSWDRNARPLSALPVHPDSITKRENKRSGRLEYVTRAGDVLDDREVIHVPGYMPPGSLTGISVIDFHRRALGLSMAVENFGANWFEDGAAPSSVLETDGELSSDDAQVQQAKWIAAHGGRRRPAVLSGGLKWKPVTITPEESQFLATRGSNTESIARMMRVPLHLIQKTDKSTSWGAGIEEQGIGFVVYTLGVHMARFEAGISQQLSKPRLMRFEVGGLLRGNTKDRYVSYAVARQWGWLSVNDIRRLEGLPPVEGGDVYLQPLNMIDANDALKALLHDSSANSNPPVGAPE